LTWLLNTNATDDPIIDRYARTICNRYEEATLLDKVLQVDHSAQTHPTSNIVSLVGTQRHIRCDVAGFPWDSCSAHRNSVNDRLGCSANRRKDYHAEFVPPLWRVANHLIRTVSVRDLQASEFNAEPTVVLC